MFQFRMVAWFFVCLCVVCSLHEVTSETKNGVCHRKLGMEDRTIHDLDITSSSVAHLVGVWWPWFARLNGDFAWLPNLALTTGSWIQVDLKELKTVTGVITQGYDGPQDKFWITSYRILYMDANWRWDIIRDQHNVTTFPGNTDAATDKTNIFERPIVARMVQLHPATWHGLPALRMELLGCDFNAPVGSAEVTSTPLPFSNAPIGPADSSSTASQSNSDMRTRQPTSSAQALIYKNGASVGGAVAAGIATLTIKTLYGSLAAVWHW